MLADDMANLPIWVDETSRITIPEMTNRVRALQADQDVGLVVFDYIGIAGDTVRGDSEERRISRVSEGLMYLAKSCHVPVVGLSQLNREVERQGSMKPTLANLRWSGDLEQNAHIVLLLYRHDYYVAQGMAQDDPKQRGIIEINIAKNRDGRVGRVQLRFQEDTLTIKENFW